MPLIHPRLLAPEDASKRKEEKLGTSMWSNSFVFEELRDGFQPVFDRYHAKTTASSVRQADIGCKYSGDTQTVNIVRFPVNEVW
jgi:hypothetical protein